jgi:nucleotide-binding universal stress UspA family protein
VFSRILATTDGTEASLRGVEVAARLAARDGCELLLLTAVSVSPQAAAAASTDEHVIESQLELMAQESLAPAVDMLRRMQVGAEVKAILGPAEEVILAEAKSNSVDLVIMGRRSRYGPKDVILGSVSYRVARHLLVPIMLVP